MTKNRRHQFGRTAHALTLTGALALTGFLLAAPVEAAPGRGGHGNGHHDRRYDSRSHDRHNSEGSRGSRGSSSRYDRYDRHDHRGHTAYRYEPGRRAYPRFAVPSRLARGHRHHYRPYRHSRSYYRPHRHHHEVYYFPVRTDRGYAYRPHSYCEGNLYVGGSLSLHGRHFSLNVGF